MDSSQSPIILFDGVCNLCNASVNFILRFEKKNLLKFASIQSESGQKLISKFSNQLISDSVLLIEDGVLYQKSDAALKIARYLKYFWILYYFIYFPHWLRNPLYNWIARNRYSWFGKRDECRLPGEDLRDRFL